MSEILDSIVIIILYFIFCSCWANYYNYMSNGIAYIVFSPWMVFYKSWFSNPYMRFTNFYLYVYTSQMLNHRCENFCAKRIYHILADLGFRKKVCPNVWKSIFGANPCSRRNTYFKNVLLRFITKSHFWKLWAMP